MTLEDFTTAFKIAHRLYKFQLIEYGRIRNVPFSALNPWDCRCPLTAVCEMRTSAVYTVTMPLTAGKQLGLSARDIQLILHAADGDEAISDAYLSPLQLTRDDVAAYRKTLLEIMGVAA